MKLKEDFLNFSQTVIQYLAMWIALNFVLYFLVIGVVENIQQTASTQPTKTAQVGLGLLVRKNNRGSVIFTEDLNRVTMEKRLFLVTHDKTVVSLWYSERFSLVYYLIDGFYYVFVWKQWFVLHF